MLSNFENIEAFERFSNAMANTLLPLILKIGERSRTRKQGLGIRLYAGPGGNLTKKQDFSLVLECYFQQNDAKDLGHPVLVITIEQNATNVVTVDGVVLLDGSFGRTVGELFENPLEVNNETINVAVEKVAQGLVLLQTSFEEALTEYLELYN